LHGRLFKLISAPAFLPALLLGTLAPRVQAQAPGLSDCWATGPASDLAFASFELQELTLPLAPLPSFEVQVALDDSAKRIVLTQRSDASSSATATRTLRRTNTTYRGLVEGWPGAVVAASLLDDGLHAVILGTPTGEVWSIRPGSSGSSAAMSGTLHEIVSAMAPPIGSTAVTSPGVQPPSLGGTGFPLLVAELAFDADYEFFVNAGGTEAATIATIENLVNQTSLFFEYYLDVCIDLNVAESVIRTSPDPSVNIYAAATTPYEMLDVMQADWNSNHASVQRDTAHLFSARIPPLFNPVGVARVGSLCSPWSGYSLSTTTDLHGLRRVIILTHELGHVFGAQHCDGDPSCGLMFPDLNVHRAFFSGLSTHKMQQRIALTQQTYGCLSSGTSALGNIELNAVTPSSLPVFGGPMRLTGNNLDQVLLVDWNGLFLDRYDFTLVNSNTIEFHATGQETFSPAHVNVIGVGGVDQLTVDVVPCSGNLYSPYREMPSLITQSWSYCGPLGYEGELLLSRSSATRSVDGFEVLRFAATVTSGMIGDPAFTDATGAGSFSWTPPTSSESNEVRFQFVIRDAASNVVGASDISTHFITPPVER
jgi:hypothetical protein